MSLCARSPRLWCCASSEGQMSGIAAITGNNGRSRTAAGEAQLSLLRIHVRFISTLY